MRQNRAALRRPSAFSALGAADRRRLSARVDAVQLESFQRRWPFSIVGFHHLSKVNLEVVSWKNWSAANSGTAMVAASTSTVR
jgi:hypothetical protein